MKNKYATIHFGGNRENEDTGETETYEIVEHVEVLYWGLTIIPVQIHASQPPVFMNRTVTFCRKLDTGEVVEVEPQLLRFKPETQNTDV